MYTISAFSFLQGASTPEDLAREAARLEYPTLTLADHDGLHGAPRFYKACKEQGVRPLVGAQITIRLDGFDGPKCRLPLLVENQTGYRNLCHLITAMKLRSRKGEGELLLRELTDRTQGLVGLSGGAEGVLRTALRRQGPDDALKLLDRLRASFSPGAFYIELQRHFGRDQEAENRTLIDWSKSSGIPLVAGSGVRYARPENRRLLDVLTCIREKTDLDRAGRLLAPNGELYLKPHSHMKRLFSDCPWALDNTQTLADRLDFTLDDLGYRFPDYPVPPGENMMSFLKRLVREGAQRRYRPFHQRARRQITHELRIIEKLELPGYFLIVWDIVRFCRENDILVQGRGSAANSAVCYALGITAVDPVGMDLLFERFLSEERGEWPDIDLDLPNGIRREQAIQYVYSRYGKRGAAMTANVITYRGKSASRDVGKALGFPQESLGRLSRLISAFHEDLSDDRLEKRIGEAGIQSSHRTKLFIRLWQEIQNLPRHLGQHSGGLVLAHGRLDSVVPLENATMPGRHVIQWDKDDCADLGLIKVDLLGLGMMSVLQDSIRLIQERGTPIDLAHLPPTDGPTFELLRRADTIGVFQVESRAQMATLPRLKPRCFYDLVVQVALIRPGPIVGRMVHPYLRRRNGREAVAYPHPSLEPILERTLGVPLFQEQLLKIAMTAAGFSGGQAEQLRRAMGFKRSMARMGELEGMLREGMARKGITGPPSDTILQYIQSFALYGFPESHSASFALLAYASAYIKTHHPAEFFTALLNNQPMGFYHPATLIKDAQRRGQVVLPIDVQVSDRLCRIEGEGSIRLGLKYVGGMADETARNIEAARSARRFTSLDDLRLRADLSRGELASLAQIGALSGLGMKRRQALWQVEKACRPGGPLFRAQEQIEAPDSSPLNEMEQEERLIADYSGSGVTVGPHPMTFRRDELSRRNVRSAQDLNRLPNGRWVRAAGMVIVRQRPMTAKGFLFLSLEDETGISNIVVTPQLFQNNKLLLLRSSFLIVEGRLQNVDNVVSVKASRFEHLDGVRPRRASHDFH